MLKLPKSVKGVLAVASAIVEAMSRRAESFAAPPTTLLEVACAIDELTDAERDAATRLRGAVEVRDARRRELVVGLQALRARVQVVASVDPARAVAIIESAGMLVRKARRTA